MNRKSTVSNGSISFWNYRKLSVVSPIQSDLEASMEKLGESIPGEELHPGDKHSPLEGGKLIENLHGMEPASFGQHA
ncbi:hypothetical protein L6452_17997 [Arctium lappa]|uniref:Uncharacterized protein n=1 Tax=Arctium lappa TaxID=4217 RepID=A0ACB9C503_ARCLA|nr:hypothetical protein L6452_17997 [Arctium lappa]